MEYRISGYLYFAEDCQLVLEHPLSYQRENLQISIKNNSKSNQNRQLDITLRIDSKDKESAVIKVENELDRISDLISWFYNDVPVVKWGISRIEDSRGVGTATATVPLSARFCRPKNLDDEDIKKFKNQLVRDYSDDFEEILIMWREALTEQSKGLKFFLFYRILERLCDGKPGEERKRVEKWIKAKEKDIEMRESKGKLVTIYTFLRDNIHAKDSRFPYADIEKYLPRLQKLTKEKIQEVFSREK